MAAKKEEESLWDLGVASSIGEISAIRKKKKKGKIKPESSSFFPSLNDIVLPSHRGIHSNKNKKMAAGRHNPLEDERP